MAWLHCAVTMAWPWRQAVVDWTKQKSPEGVTMQLAPATQDMPFPQRHTPTFPHRWQPPPLVQVSPQPPQFCGSEVMSFSSPPQQRCLPSLPASVPSGRATPVPPLQLPVARQVLTLQFDRSHGLP